MPILTLAAIPTGRHEPSGHAGRVAFYGELNSPNDRLFREYEDDAEIPFILNEGHLPVKFRTDIHDSHYEGAVRFYAEDGQNELTKTVRLTNKTSVEELIPSLVLKFRLPPARYALFDVQEDEAVYLYPKECPLALAISAHKVPRFLLRQRILGRLDKVESSNDHGDSHLADVRSRPDDSVNFSKSNKKFAKQQQKSPTRSESVEGRSSAQMKQQNGFEHEKSFGSVESQATSLQQAEEENHEAYTNRKYKKKKPSNNVKNKKSGTVSNMFQKHKSDGTMMFAPEMSMYQVAPGILKVFGDHVSPGSNYKAVRASTISTAQEVVIMALERYGLESSNPRDYVLCDVVGHFESPENGKKELEEGAKWITDCVRTISDNEKPLVVQSLWKPAGERLRRFELHFRTDLETSCFFINTADGIGRSMSENSVCSSDGSSLVSGNDGSRSRSSSNKDDVFHITAGSSASKSGDGVISELSPRAPLHVPFLLLIRGFKNDLDFLVYELVKETSIVGPRRDQGSLCDIILHAGDILLPHCRIHKKVQSNVGETNFQVSVEPASGAEVAINGIPVDEVAILHPGQLLQLGKSYIFLFRDPTQIGDLLLQISWPANSITKKLDSSFSDCLSKKSLTSSVSPQMVFQTDKNIQVDLRPQSSSTRDSSGESLSSDDEIESSAMKSRQTNAIVAPRKPVNKSQLQFSYEYKDEDDLLNAIVDVAGDIPGFKLAPAYLFMMTLEHSAAMFTEIQTRKLLLKMSSILQGLAWDKTKEIGKQPSLRDEDGLAILTRLLPELVPVLLWMSVALEMSHFLQAKLGTYLLPREQVATSKDALLTADKEFLAVLEEVLMFTFQQTVYHLTKVLYMALPAVIGANPFQADEDVESDSKPGQLHPTISKVVQIFSDILAATARVQLHPQITGQLFAYLFFFSNASLFNSLMEKGTGGKFYRWAKGVQIRGNVEALEDWASHHELHSQFNQYMRRFSAAVNLISTPKAQLMQMDWSTMRAEFAALNAAQLHQILSEYQLNGKPRPRGWFPPADEMEAALRSSDILESFATHPPFVRPASNFQLDLSKAPRDPSFSKHLETITKRFARNAEVDGTPTAKRPENPKKTGLSTSVGSAASPSEMVSARGDGRASSIVSEDSIAMNAVVPSSTKPVDASPSCNPIQRTVDYQPTPIHRLRHEASRVDPTHEPVATQVVVAADPCPCPASPPLPSVSTRETIRVVPRIPRPPPASPTPVPPAPVNRPAASDSGTLLERARDLLARSGEADSDSEEVDGQVSLEAGSFSGDHDDVVFIAELERGGGGLGLGLIDGKFTLLKNSGIYIRTLLPNTPASKDPRIRVGDRILAVNGTSLVGFDYGSAMDLIKKSGDRLTFLIASSDDVTVDMIHKSSY